MSSIHLTMAFALFLPNDIQCQLMAGSGLSTTGIRRTGLPLNSEISGFAVVFSSLGIGESSFFSFSWPDLWSLVTPQLFHAGSGLAGWLSWVSLVKSTFSSPQVGVPCQ